MTRSRAAAGHAEDTVPYPETGQTEERKKSTNLIGMTTDQKQRDVEPDEYFLKKEKVYCWRSSVGRKDSAVCTLPFQPSSVTTFCLKT